MLRAEYAGNRGRREWDYRNHDEVHRLSVAFWQRIQYFFSLLPLKVYSGKNKPFFHKKFLRYFIELPSEKLGNIHKCSWKWSLIAFMYLNYSIIDFFWISLWKNIVLRLLCYIFVAWKFERLHLRQHRESPFSTYKHHAVDRKWLSLLLLNTSRLSSITSKPYTHFLITFWKS